MKCKTLERLFKGGARKAIRTLFAGRNSAQDIMESLRVRFGSPHIILSQIISEIQELPRVDPQKTSFVDVATNLRNEVQIIRGLL